jgi:dipeptidyl aminopeptidase/acylaminoacyl peptidase
MAENSKPGPFTVETLWAIRRVGAPAASSDGSVIVAPVTSYDMETNESKTRLYRLFADGGDPRPLTSAEGSAGDPAVSPDRTRVAFVRKDDKGKGQLAVMPLDGGEAEILTDMPLGVIDPKWFPDGKRIAFLGYVLADAPTPEGTKKLQEEREKDPVKAHITEDRIFRFWDGWLTDGKVLHVFVYELASAKLTDLTPELRQWFDPMDPKGSYDISPDGREIAFSVDRSDPPHDPTNWDVFTVPADGGEIRNITRENPADDMRPRYSPDGRWILYGMQRMLDFYADRQRLVAYDRRTGEHRVLTEQWDFSASGWEFAPDGRTVLLTAEDEGRISVYRTAIEVADPERIVRGGSYGGLIPLTDGSFLAGFNDMSHPPQVVRISAGEKKTTRIENFNDELLAKVALGEVREFRYEGSEGRTIQSYLVLPPGFDPKKKYPLVEMLHGGPHGISGDNFHFRWNPHLMAAPGYVVLAPNFHGSTGWGQDFAASIHGGWGDKPYRDAMAGVDAILAEGFVDEKRMAAVGGSYGGYLVSWIAGQTDRFACIVNHAGVSDTLSQFASDVTYGRERSLGGNPWDGLEAIDRMNPIRFAKGFKTPMLVVHGERDFRVPVTQGLAIYNVYKAKRVPARLVYFPDENHWVLKPRNAQLWYREFHGWLARWFEAARA